MKQLILFCVILALLCVGLGKWLRAEPPTPTQSMLPATANPALTTDPLPTPLPAEQFSGRTRDAYKAAAEIPDILAGLHCYCGCDKSIGHRSLLDCFVDDHGAG